MNTLPLELQMNIYHLACMGELTDKIKEIPGKQPYKKYYTNYNGQWEDVVFMNYKEDGDYDCFENEEPSKFQDVRHKNMFLNYISGVEYFPV